MAKIFIKSDEDENSILVKNILQKYIRQETVHNLSVHESNADFCISLICQKYPEEEKFHSYFYNNTQDLEELSNKIYYQCSKAEIKTRALSKKSMPKDEYDIEFKCPTLIISLTNDSKYIDEEVYGIVIGQGIVSHLDPGKTFDTFSIKDKIKKPGEKSSVNRKFIKESTSNSKLLFKK
jgi:hypothetical protein